MTSQAMKLVWKKYKLTTESNENKPLFELSDDTKAILNSLQDEFEQNVIDMDKTVCSQNEGWGRGIKKFSGIFSKSNLTLCLAQYN